MPQIGALFMYDNNYEYIDWFDCSVVVFTKSQLAEFKSSGKLPPMTNMWGSFEERNVDLSSHVDLTELKALLSSAQTPAPSGKTASPTASTVYVNGTAKAFEAYNIDGNNYFKLRDLASVLSGTGKQFEVGYDEDTKAITLTSGNPYTAVGGEMAAGNGKAKDAIPTASKIYLDGSELNLTVYNISGNNFLNSAI